MSQSSDTISGLCRRHRFSRGSYYNMKKRGNGPREMRYGHSVRITDEAEADWIRALEAAQKKRCGHDGTSRQKTAAGRRARRRL